MTSGQAAPAVYRHPVEGVARVLFQLPLPVDLPDARAGVDEEDLPLTVDDDAGTRVGEGGSRREEYRKAEKPCGGSHR
jgi:hypothetical protein